MRAVPVDIQMLKNIRAAREYFNAPFACEAMDYQSMGLIVASSRRCNDGHVVDKLEWLPGLSAVDMMYVKDRMEGFDAPVWPHCYDPRH